MKLHKPHFPRWYGLNAHCDYHYGVQGHTTASCVPLKYKVQLLIKPELLDFNKNNGPSVTANPIPNHVRPSINAIMEDSS